MTDAGLDLEAANLRIARGSVPASTQLAEALKAAIVKQRVPRGGRLPTERELIDRTGLSRVTVRAAVGLLERQGWLIRRQGLGTFVANPVKQELGSGVRTITEVLAASGITPSACREQCPAPARELSNGAISPDRLALTSATADAKQVLSIRLTASAAPRPPFLTGQSRRRR